MNYQEFLTSKIPKRKLQGFKPLWIPKEAFDFQAFLIDWDIRMGRAATFAGCGLGKSVIELTCAYNFCQHTKGNSLFLTPLAVVPQMLDEAKKFGIKARRTKQGEVHKGINITNYHRLQYYRPSDFTSVILDEASICKNFDGKYRKAITEFISKVPFRLLATATPAPNDYMELGTLSEALGVMGRNQMLGMFFVNDGETTQQWRLKGHAKKAFWKWVASWARAVRKPSDLGFSDEKFILPNLNTRIHKVPSKAHDGFFAKIATSLKEQRLEKKQTLKSRCEKAASVLPNKRPVIAWCHLNAEADLLTELIPNAVQVKGGDDDEYKEEILITFARGHIPALVTKPSIAGLGLNLQVCSDLTCFPSHSHEQYYQLVRRCWRYGQLNEVNCHIIASQAESSVLSNMLRKERASDEMYNEIVREMHNADSISKVETNGFVEDVEIPTWL
jgi:hypothetical protein